MPRVELWVPLVEEDYPGWYFLLWRNHPLVFRTALIDATNESERRAAIRRLARAHNGWRYTDVQGEEREFPPMDSDAFWDVVPNEVANAVIMRIRIESTFALPNSLAAKPMSSAASSAIEPSTEAASASEDGSPGPSSDEA